MNTQQRNDNSFPLARRIECVDGFSISVQASEGSRCYPRTNFGPWESVECGFPSSTPDIILNYAELRDKPLQSVYGNVPIELVEELINVHGGMKFRPSSISTLS